MTETEIPISPRLALLQAALVSGNESALADFWREIEAGGTPMIEPLPESNNQEALVTFLYRASQPVDHVEVVSPLGGKGRINESMIRMLETNLWYRTYKTSMDLRTEYWLLIDGTNQPDPLNPRTLTYPPAPDRFFDKTTPESWFELPAVPGKSWLMEDDGELAGVVEQVHLTSPILSNDRLLTLYAPPGLPRENGSFPVLLLFDRWAYTDVIPTTVMIDRLITNKTIPPLIVVMIGHPDDTMRSIELACNASFTDFLAQELLPWVRTRFQISTHPAQTIVGGMSLGGLAAAYAGLRYPALFGNILSQSGAFYWKPEQEREYEWLTRQFVASPRLPLKWYLSVGLLETRPSMGARPNLLIANRHLRDVLQAKGYPLHYTEFNGGHDFLWQLPVLADGLRTFFSAGPE